MPITKCEDAHVTLGIGYSVDLLTRGGLPYNIGMGRQRVYETREPTAAPYLSLLYVNKQIKNEILRLGWEGCKRCFIDHEVFTAAVDSKVGVARQFEILGRVQLSFTARAWFKFFGVAINADTGLAQDTSGSLGRYLVKLKDECNLELQFRDPHDGHFGDPFGFTATTCQTIMIDWIMTLAFSQIVHIKYINLIGCIKKAQKEKWQRILSSQRNETGYNFDYIGALQSVLATPVENP